jgi:hypothetical protein
MDILHSNIKRSAQALVCFSHISTLRLTRPSFQLATSKHTIPAKDHLKRLQRLAYRLADRRYPELGEAGGSESEGVAIRTEEAVFQLLLMLRRNLTRTASDNTHIHTNTTIDGGLSLRLAGQVCRGG